VRKGLFDWHQPCKLLISSIEEEQYPYQTNGNDSEVRDLAQRELGDCPTPPTKLPKEQSIRAHLVFVSRRIMDIDRYIDRENYEKMPRYGCAVVSL
jgi:hypothetical protein